MREINKKDVELSKEMARFIPDLIRAGVNMIGGLISGVLVKVYSSYYDSYKKVPITLKEGG